MATVSVEMSASSTFTEVAAHEMLAEHCSQESLIPALQSFCSREMTQSEHQILLENPNLVCQEAVKAMQQVAILANARNDPSSAYFFHRKAELISACLEQGVTEFFDSLQDPEAALQFCARVGPPPGYEDEYWDDLIDSYKEGDHIQQQLNLQEYQPQMTADIGFQPSDDDLSIVSDVMELLKTKYDWQQLLESEGHPNLPLSVDERTLTAMRSQMQERLLLVQEFVSSGLSIMLNWLLSMIPTARYAVLEQCIADVILMSPLSTILSVRQRRHLLPEISDIPMLVGNTVEPLRELFVRIASGLENNFALDSSGSLEVQNASASFVTRLTGANNEQDLVLLIKELDIWARQQSREHWFNVLAVLRIEHLVESSLLLFAPEMQLPNGIPRRALEFEQFVIPFTMYRTRGLQLFALSLIEKCLKTCLPAQQPPTSAAQSKKRKRHM